MFRKNISDSLAFLSNIFSRHDEQLSAIVNHNQSTHQTLQNQIDKEVRADQFRVRFWDKDTKKVVASSKKVRKISLYFLLSAPYEQTEREITIYVVGFTPNLELIKTEVSSPFITTAEGREKTYDCMFQDSIQIYSDPRTFYYGFDVLRSFSHAGVYLFKIYTDNLLVSTAEVRIE